MVRMQLTSQIVEHGVHRPDTLWRHGPRRSVTLDTPSTMHASRHNGRDLPYLSYLSYLSSKPSSRYVNDRL
jgi:hypothetical protein